MPTYDYKCGRCGKAIEVTHPMSMDGDRALLQCACPSDRICEARVVEALGGGEVAPDRVAAEMARLEGCPEEVVVGGLMHKPLLRQIAPVPTHWACPRI